MGKWNCFWQSTLSGVEMSYYVLYFYNEPSQIYYKFDGLQPIPIEFGENTNFKPQSNWYDNYQEFKLNQDVWPWLFRVPIKGKWGDEFFSWQEAATAMCVNGDRLKKFREVVQKEFKEVAERFDLVMRGELSAKNTRDCTRRSLLNLVEEIVYEFDKNANQEMKVRNIRNVLIDVYPFDTVEDVSISLIAFQMGLPAA